DERRCDFVTETLAQDRAQVTDAVGEPKLDRPAAGPILAGEQVLFGAGEPAAAALLDQRDKVIVDLTLHCLEPLHVVRLLRQGRSKRPLLLARRIEAAPI